MKTIKLKKKEPLQVYFPVEVVFRLRFVAKKKGKNVAEYIRDVVEKDLTQEVKGGKVFSDKIPTFDLGGPLKEGEIDEILYNKP